MHSPFGQLTEYNIFIVKRDIIMVECSLREGNNKKLKEKPTLSKNTENSKFTGGI